MLAGISYDAADPEAEALETLSAQMPPDAVTTLLEGLTARQEAAAAQAADALAALDRQLSTLQTTLGAAEQAERQRQEVAGELAKARSTAQLESARPLKQSLPLWPMPTPAGWSLRQKQPVLPSGKPR